MCENAKFYNEEGSLVHSNAEEVEVNRGISGSRTMQED
jgi:hypothetical protein